MLSIVTLAMNAAINYLLPFRSIYRMLIYDESPNFHDLRGGGYRGKKAERAIEALKTERAAQAGVLSTPPAAPTAAPTAAPPPYLQGRGDPAPLRGTPPMQP